MGRFPELVRELAFELVLKPVLGLAAAGMLLAATPTQAAAQTADAPQALAGKDVPRLVAARLRCADPQGQVTRRAFAGGFVFDQTCRQRDAAQTRVVFSTTRDGKDARLLQFHGPEGRRLSSLASIAFEAGKDEISGTVARLSRRICRAEGRWRMEGRKPAPALVYWRHTRDCEGKRGWQVMVNRRS
jgi:hypothetical protein